MNPLPRTVIYSQVVKARKSRAFLIQIAVKKRERDIRMNFLQLTNHLIFAHHLRTEVFGSNGSVGDGRFVRYSRKSVTLGFFNGQNVRYSENPLFPNPVLPKTSVCSTLNKEVAFRGFTTGAFQNVLSYSPVGLQNPFASIDSAAVASFLFKLFRLSEVMLNFDILADVFAVCQNRKETTFEAMNKRVNIFTTPIIRLMT